MSLHHPTVVHGSGLNKSKDRRIGFVVQSYIGSNVDQVIGKIFVQKARGEDNHKFHEYSKVPKELMNKEDIISWNKAKDELSKIFYSGSKKKENINIMNYSISSIYYCPVKTLSFQSIESCNVKKN